MIANSLPRLHRLVLVLLLSLPLLPPAATPAKAKPNSAAKPTAAAAARASNPAAPPRDCPPTAQDPTPEQVPQLMESARDRGMLWRLTKDGRTSHLYGTLHVGRLEWL